MPAEEPVRLPIPDEAASPMYIRGLPPSLAMTIRSTVPCLTTVEYATSAYEWLVNPTIRAAVCESMDQFMLQPSSSTLFTSSYNPPVASYYGNDPDPSILRPHSSEPSSSSSIRRGSSISSTRRDKSSSSNRRVSSKRHLVNPYPSFSSSSHSLSNPSHDDFFDNNNYSTSSLQTTQAELAQVGPSLPASMPLSPMELSPLPMAISPSPMGPPLLPDTYPSSPMMWSPPDELSFPKHPQDIFSFSEIAGDIDLGLQPYMPITPPAPQISVDLSPEPSTSVALPTSQPSDHLYEVQGITTAGKFMPIVIRTPSKVALDDNTSILSTNTAASSSVGSPGDLNSILKLVFSDSGSVFQGAEFVSTKYIRHQMPVVAELGKSSRLLMQGLSFKGSQWTHVGISIPNAISPLSQLTMDIFCGLQSEHSRTYGQERLIESCKHPNDPLMYIDNNIYHYSDTFEIAKSILFATHMAAHQYRISMQSSYKASFASHVIDGWYRFLPAEGEKLTFRKLIEASTSISKELSQMAKGNLVCSNLLPP